MPPTEKKPLLTIDNSPDSYFNGFVLFHPKQIIILIVSESNPVLVGATPYLLHAILNWTSPPVALVHVTKGACNQRCMLPITFEMNGINTNT